MLKTGIVLLSMALVAAAPQDPPTPNNRCCVPPSEIPPTWTACSDKVCNTVHCPNGSQNGQVVGGDCYEEDDKFCNGYGTQFQVSTYICEQHLHICPDTGILGYTCTIQQTTGSIQQNIHCKPGHKGSQECSPP